MLEWYQNMMTFKQSTPDSITLPFSAKKTMLVPFESLDDALQHRMLNNEHGVANSAA